MITDYTITTNNAIEINKYPVTEYCNTDWNINTTIPYWYNPGEYIKYNYNIGETQMENKSIMKVFKVIVVDKKSCEILHEQKVIAKNKEFAMLKLNLTKEQMNKVEDDSIEFIFAILGEFEKIEED